MAGDRVGARSGSARLGEDQRWTLVRISVLAARHCHVCFSRRLSRILRQMDFSVQVVVHRAAERDDKQAAVWRRAATSTGNAGGISLSPSRRPRRPSGFLQLPRLVRWDALQATGRVKSVLFGVPGGRLVNESL
ncbi:helix-turn-helix domain-containing protein [Streptomyces halobius]|uniref:Winged helix-turn-helix domain-containing protein n=1 Tax=Streptomyces halobius TaxID=2879846 RepID=A0ABY4MEU3_9ACTN|nr:winged helix-turn-helix domain-containing protein [Streptomyces halobius]